MNWFDEQIKQRRQADNEVFEDALADMAGAVLGQRMARSLNDQRILAKNAIEEVLKYYHVKSMELPDDVSDLNDQLEYLMRPYGIMRRDVNLEQDWYKDASGAMLGQRSDNDRVVALLPKKTGGYHFLDEESGKWITLNRKTQQLIRPEAIAFYKPFPQKKLAISDLLLFMAGTLSGVDLAALVLVTLIVTLLGMAAAATNSVLFGKVVSMGSYQLLAAISVFLICMSVGKTILETGRTLIMSRINTKLSMCIEAASMMRVLSLPASFFSQYSSGELSSYTSNLNSLCSLLVNIFLSVGLTSVFSLIYITQIFTFAGALVVPVLCIIAVTVVTSLLFTLLQTGISKKKLILSAKDSGMSFALLSGVQKIRLAGAEKRAFARWAEQYTKEASLEYNPPAFVKLNSVIQLAISSVGTLVIYFLAVKSQISPSDYMAFNVSYSMVLGAFSSLTSVVSQLAQIKPILDTVKPLLETEPETAENKKVLTRISGGIELSHVSFRYRENMPLVLDDFSLSIRPGQYIAVVGRTGCGKSTLVRLLLGFETPQKGSVFYDGKDLQSVDMRSLRKKIGVVTQNGKLFSGSIFSNIAVSAPQLTLDGAWEAAQMAGIADDIRQMPMQMHTVISEGSGGISGGQKQRLMIARAIAPRPKILIFDEATSALDNMTQKKVSESLDGLKCTRIVIAHRLSTIRQCDRIIVLDGGHIIEDGTYEQLIERKGFFADLVSRQQID